MTIYQLVFTKVLKLEKKYWQIRKQQRANYHFRVYLKVIFGFAENQYNCTNGLGYKLTLQRNSDNHVLSQLEGTDVENIALAGRVIINDINSYIPHYTPSIANQKLMLEHIISKSSTKLSYIKRSSYMKNVLKNPSRALKVSGIIASAAASRNPKATLSTLKGVIDFYHTGRGSYLGIFVWIML